MRFNDRELVDVCSSKPIFEGRLNYRSPSGNFGQSGFKERWFRLTCNLLFYFRINEAGKVDAKPSGVFVLENSNIQHEQSSSIPFAFSITFRDEPEKKHIFSGRSDANVQEWIASIKHCTYEYLRSQRILLQKQITFKTGKDPLLMYPYNEGATRDFQLLPEPFENAVPPSRPPPPKVAPSSSQLSRTTSAKSFQSHLRPSAPQQSASKERLSPTLPNKTSVPLNKSFQSHVGPLVPQRSVSKGRLSPSLPNKTPIPLHTSVQSSIRPLVSQRVAPAVPLPKPEVQSSSVVPSSEMNLIEF